MDQNMISLPQEELTLAGTWLISEPFLVNYHPPSAVLQPLKKHYGIIIFIEHTFNCAFNVQSQCCVFYLFVFLFLYAILLFYIWLVSLSFNKMFYYNYYQIHKNK